MYGWQNYTIRNKKKPFFFGQALRKDDSIILYFESGQELVNTIEWNVAAKRWDLQGIPALLTDEEEEDVDVFLANHEDIKRRGLLWQYGPHFPGYEQTAEAVTSGRSIVAYAEDIDWYKDELYRKWPKLWELREIALTKKRRRRYSEMGDELDIDRYMCADVNMWSSMPRQDTIKKNIRIYIDLVANIKIEQSALTQSLIIATVICDIVAAAGISIEILIGETTAGRSRDGHMTNVTIKAKAFDEPMDIFRVLSFALPGFTRQFKYTLLRNYSNAEVDHSIGWAAYSKDQPDIIEYFNPDIILHAGESNSDYDMAHVLQQLEKVFRIGGG